MANEARLQAFLARASFDLAAAQSAVLVALGDRLGLYRALQEAGALSAGELAARTGTSERYLREWLANQVCGGYLEHDPAADTFRLPEEHARVLADEGHRAFLGGAFQAAVALAGQADALAEAFRTGGGVAQVPEAVGEGIARSAAARHRAELLVWVRALPGVAERLSAGGTVLDLGCGRGEAALLLAEAFPAARVVGVDVDGQALEAARQRAGARGLAGRVRFEPAAGDASFTLVMCLESLHEMSDPVAAARDVLVRLAAGGAWLVVEAELGERLEPGLGTWGRLVTSMAALHCLPLARGQGGDPPGSLARERWVREVAGAAGFSQVRRAAEHPFLSVLEARA